MKLNPYLTSLTKTNSKWIKSLTIKPKIIKVLEENIGINVLYMGLGNDFFGRGGYDTYNRRNTTKKTIGTTLN